MNQAEALYDFFKTHPKYRGVEATENMLITNCQRPVTVQTLEAAALRLGDRLAVSGDYSRAYAHFFALHPEIEDCDATRNILDREHHGDDITAESLEDIFQIPSVRARLPESIKYQQQRVAQRERERKIAELTGGADHYKYFDGRYGQYRRYPAAELQTVDDAEFQRIYKLVMEQRRIAGLPSAEQRKVVQQPTTAELPETWEVPSTGEVISLTRREMIRKIKNNDDWRKLLNQFGQKAVNAILKGQI